jgi:hypothetical protein
MTKRYEQAEVESRIEVLQKLGSRGLTGLRPGSLDKATPALRIGWPVGMICRVASPKAHDAEMEHVDEPRQRQCLLLSAVHTQLYSVLVIWPRVISANPARRTCTPGALHLSFDDGIPAVRDCESDSRPLHPCRLMQEVLNDCGNILSRKVSIEAEGSRYVWGLWKHQGSRLCDRADAEERRPK